MISRVHSSALDSAPETVGDRAISVTRFTQTISYTGTVAPSRERGLKRVCGPGAARAARRSLTGAWIETRGAVGQGLGVEVAPSRERGLKHDPARQPRHAARVAPSRERGL